MFGSQMCKICDDAIQNICVFAPFLIAVIAIGFIWCADVSVDKKLAKEQPKLVEAMHGSANRAVEHLLLLNGGVVSIAITYLGYLNSRNDKLEKVWRSFQGFILILALGVFCALCAGLMGFYGALHELAGSCWATFFWSGRSTFWCFGSAAFVAGLIQASFTFSANNTGSETSKSAELVTIVHEIQLAVKKLNDFADKPVSAPESQLPELSGENISSEG